MAELLTMLYNRGGFLGVRVCGHETADFEMLLKSYVQNTVYQPYIVYQQMEVEISWFWMYLVFLLLLLLFLLIFACKIQLWITFWNIFNPFIWNSDNLISRYGWGLDFRMTKSMYFSIIYNAHSFIDDLNVQREIQIKKEKNLIKID